VKSF